MPWEVDHAYFIGLKVARVLFFTWESDQKSLNCGSGRQGRGRERWGAPTSPFLALIQGSLETEHSECHLGP